MDGLSFSAMTPLLLLFFFSVLSAAEPHAWNCRWSLTSALSLSFYFSFFAAQHMMLLLFCWPPFLFVLLALPLGSFFISSSRAIRYTTRYCARTLFKQPALSRMCSPTRSTDGPCVTLGSPFCSSLSLSLIGHYKPSPHHPQQCLSLYYTHRADVLSYIYILSLLLSARQII